MIAKQLRDPLPEIPPDKILDLLAIKKKLGLPDARFPDEEIELPNSLSSSSGVTANYFQTESAPDEQFDGFDGIAADLTVRIVRLLEELS